LRVWVVSDVRLSDVEIDSLVAEVKPTINPGELLPTTVKLGHRRGAVEVEGRSGSNFKVLVRQQEANPLDFSVVLGYKVPESTRIFRLRRFNGLSHQHTNPLEDESFYAFHIHQATERYQALAGSHEEHYATPTDGYVDLAGAVDHMFATCGFEPPAQLMLGPT
jgi:hypothetical protein